MEIDQSVLQVAMTQAIVRSVSPEMQAEIFQRALHEHLFRVPSSKERSTISESFKRSLDDACRAIASDLLKEPENLAKIKEAIQTALDQALKEPEFKERLAKRFITTLSGGY
jgi:hypothetical protein